MVKTEATSARNEPLEQEIKKEEFVPAKEEFVPVKEEFVPATEEPTERKRKRDDLDFEPISSASSVEDIDVENEMYEDESYDEFEDDDSDFVDWKTDTKNNAEAVVPDNSVEVEDM